MITDPNLLLNLGLQESLEFKYGYYYSYGFGMPVLHIAGGLRLLEILEVENYKRGFNK